MKNNTEISTDTIDQDLYDDEHVGDYYNPTYLFNCTATDLLVMIVQGAIDPIALAKQQLKNRGLDNTGTYVGFGKR